MRLRLVGIALMLSGLSSLPARGSMISPMYIADSANNLLAVDVDSGHVELIGGTAAQFTDIAFGPDGRLFGVTTTYLYEIDPSNGWSSLIGAHGYGDPVAGYGIDALAFDDDGVLYAAGNDIVITIDPETGTGTTLGTLSGYRSAGDLAVDGVGRLFLATDVGDLVEVHRDGSGATPVSDLGYTDIFAFGRHADGSLYGIRSTNAILAINPDSGQVTNHGKLEADFLIGRAWGGSFPIEPMPEPSTGLLIASGVLLLMYRRRCT